MHEKSLSELTQTIQCTYTEPFLMIDLLLNTLPGPVSRLVAKYLRIRDHCHSGFSVDVFLQFGMQLHYILLNHCPFRSTNIHGVKPCSFLASFTIAFGSLVALQQWFALRKVKGKAEAKLLTCRDDYLFRVYTCVCITPYTQPHKWCRLASLLILGEQIALKQFSAR